ncbi:Txe/YoeB family toxin of toxin-antitoxin system [Pseudomonas sp. BIGb0408]|uniref:Txe/YoeB family toxin of toxin-antitoxin system n=1 Tax=Phytopseudomonas flavescens TaxID=29435 RepID=A0A7Y9XLY0_9GAMM|nr:Txe/YoeB family toxin of toxin-antitoxin system [Pseudomonas sp. BIGb0408]NYH72399.1 Txe/YoeB family toxin of toxin-antitoxin system [Pseudomonas flavescens]
MLDECGVSSPPAPPYEKLAEDLNGACSRRSNVQHRLAYQVPQDEHVIKVLRLWTHCE